MREFNSLTLSRMKLIGVNKGKTEEKPHEVLKEYSGKVSLKEISLTKPNSKQSNLMGTWS